MQIGFGDIAERKVNKPMAGHFDKAGVEPEAHLAEIRLDEGDEVKVGDESPSRRSPMSRRST